MRLFVWWPLEAGTVTVMFLVEVVATLVCDRRLTDDEITDMIEAVVDELDARSLDPSVGTARVGDDVELTVVVTMPDPVGWEALTQGVAAVRGAFEAADVGAVGLGAPRDVRSHVTPLQPA
jgi:hypothetical protein